MEFSVLNYPGSKKRLINFLQSSINNHLLPNQTLLDIFSGTSSVGYSYKNRNKIIANDAEIYAYNISKAILSNSYFDFNLISEEWQFYYKYNLNNLENAFSDSLKKENISINSDNLKNVVDFNNSFNTIFDVEDPSSVEVNLQKLRNLISDQITQDYCLFTLYYSKSYFGLKQSIEIDSIRYAISKFPDNEEFLLTALYFAMKETVFSKDGHMAQPLNYSKNFVRFIKTRKKNIYDIFIKKIKEFNEESFSLGNFKNKVYKLNFLDLINESKIANDIDMIYADPPYTDMQYSRYFHLLTTVTEYDFSLPTIKNNEFTKGLYLENRFQSSLSKKKYAFDDIKKLIHFANENQKKLALSYAYPEDSNVQKTDRYTFDIADIINEFEKTFNQTAVYKTAFTHANNRNSNVKNVYEYLVVGE